MGRLIRNGHKRIRNNRPTVTAASVNEIPRTTMPASHLRRLHARNRLREAILPPEDIAPAAHILVTGGIGDFIVLESHMEPERRAAVQHITLATRAYKGIQELLGTHACFPNLDVVSNVQINWAERFCFTQKEELSLLNLPELSIEDAQDWSILIRFPFIERGVLKFQKSSYVTNKVADISRFELPTKYIVCNPYSPNDRRSNRDFSKKDWEFALEVANNDGVPLVVVNVSDDFIPDNPAVINLNHKTSLPESIEVVKGAYKYVGIDSCLSIIAAQSMIEENIKIKSNNGHLYSHKRIYYAPLKHANLIMESF